jgi:GNAT superfamily N-acetyltransferase
MPVPTDELAARLPDLPRLVETRAMLLSGACEVLGDPQGGNYVVRSLDKTLAAIVGRPSPAAIRDAATRTDGVDILCPEDATGAAGWALPEWNARPAMIHVLGDARAPARPDPPLDVRLVGGEERVPLGHLPAPLRQEMEAARRRSPFSVGFAAGVPASFAYAPWQTESLCDVSIDTLEGYRQRGLGSATAWLLIDHMRARGKRPVWGAMEGNVASLRLAARLGFVPVDRLFVISRASAAEDAR